MDKINIHDLMAGDWIIEHAYGWNSDGTKWEADLPCVVTSISLSGIMGKYDDDVHYIQSFSPINITPDFLVKNRFWKKPFRGEYFWSFDDDPNIIANVWSKDCLSFRVDILNKKDNLYNNYMGYIKYVHQLQHILHLCEIDKKIVI